jgi:hypothetical protein
VGDPPEQFFGPFHRNKRTEQHSKAYPSHPTSGNKGLAYKCYMA